MRNTLILLLAIATSFTLNSCDNYVKETELFSSYLFNHYDKNLEDKLYIIIPQNICISCVDKMQAKIEKRKDKSKNYIVILADYTSVTFQKPKEQLKDFEVLEDNKMNIIKEKIIIGTNIVLINVFQGNIDEIIGYTPFINDEQIENLLDK